MPHAPPARPVLVVEDDTDSRLMLATILTMQGYQTVGASNGAEALALAHEHQPCLILLDLMMPVMSGEEFRQAQRLDDELKDIPVVLLTARHDAALKAQQLGVEGCIGKPINVREVLTQVATHCNEDRF